MKMACMLVQIKSTQRCILELRNNKRNELVHIEACKSVFIKTIDCIRYSIRGWICNLRSAVICRTKSACFDV